MCKAELVHTLSAVGHGTTAPDAIVTKIRATNAARLALASEPLALPLPSAAPARKKTVAKQLLAVRRTKVGSRGGVLDIQIGVTALTRTVAPERPAASDRVATAGFAGGAQAGSRAHKIGTRLEIASRISPSRLRGRRRQPGTECVRHRAQHCSQATGGGSTPMPGGQRRAAGLLLLEGIIKNHWSSSHDDMKVMKSGGLPQKYTLASLS